MNQDPHILNEKLERSILHGLACEWEAAIGQLTPELRGRMRIPKFILTDSEKQLGAWSAEKQVIFISRRLVMNFAWDDVRDVLWHEIAHQMVSNVFTAESETAHGPVFQEACRLLRANPKASGEYRPLSERIQAEADAMEDRLIRRVRKLMALARSHNRNEAEAAMDKARELMEKYNIDAVSRTERGAHASIFIGQPALRHHRETYTLAHLLEDFYFVRCIWVPAYVIEKQKMGHVLEISGTAPNLKIAGYVHAFITRFIDKEWADYNISRNMTRSRKTDFAIGIVKGFRQKMEAGQPKASSESHENIKSLVLYADAVFNAYLRHRYPRIRHYHLNGKQVDGTVMSDGEKVGNRLVISQGIEQRSTEMPPALCWRENG